MPIFQTSITSRPAEGILGSLVTGITYCSTKAARGLIKAGLGVFKVPGVGGRGSNMLDPGEVFQLPSPAAAADADAITVLGTSATGTSTLADGVVGSAEMQPPRRLTVTFDASTDWDATVGTITFINHLGVQVTENVAIATSTSVTTTGYAQRFVSFTKPAQTGAGGVYTIGVAAMAALAATDFRGVAVRQIAKQTLSSSDLWRATGNGATSLSVTADYVDAESVPCLTGGGIWVGIEEDVADGDPVYVRVAAGAGGSVVGMFRNDADTASAVLVPNAKFVRDALASNGIAWAEFNSRG